MGYLEVQPGRAYRAPTNVSRNSAWPILMALALSTTAGAERLRVCTLAFHGPEETAVFTERLPAEDFELLDLSSRPSPFREACRAAGSCDVVVFSAEFAGRFFGSYGRSLTLQELEEASCQPACTGLLHAPREVFLLACNTLATKDQDHRTPADYLQVLLAHGFDRTSAERVVALRYGPLGPSFREAFRRIFMGVPRIYGFASVAPSGPRAAPLLDDYFRKVGDYRHHLERTWDDHSPNNALLTAFASSSLVQVSGLSPSDPAVGDRERMCALYDEQRPVTERLAIIDGLLARSDVLSFLPTIQVFFDRHPPSGFTHAEQRQFEAIRNATAARDTILALIRDLDVSALQLELAHFALHLGWIDHAAFRALAREDAWKLLHRPLTSETADVVCEIPKHESLADVFTASDLATLFTQPEGLRVIDCLAPVDPRVDPALVGALDSSDEPTRLWAAFALSHRLPLSETALVAMARCLSDPSPELRARAQWIFRVQRPLSGPVREAVRRFDPAFADELRRH